MAKEVLEYEVKSNIKSVTKDTQDWGKSLDNVTKSIEVQEKVLNDLEKELIQLKSKQDSIPKGAWYAGMDDLNKKIKKTETNIKLEKNALKGLKLEQKEASKEVKKFNEEQKETDKAITGSIGNFNVMGVSLNGIKSAFGQIIPAAKAMFGTIKAGLMSTGIGALLVAFGSLATYFTSTKKGADQLKVAFTAVGATVDVLKDRISTFGGAIVKVFKGDIKGAMQDVKGITKGVVDEIKEEVKIMTQLEKASQRLRDAEIEFSIQKAKTRQEIEKARLAAEDESLSAAVRLENLKKALALEEETTNRELELAEEAVRIQELQMAQSENLVEDEKKLADLKVALIEKETASVKMRRRVMTEVNTFEREIQAEKDARAKEEQDRIDKQKAEDEKALKEKLDRQKKEADILLALQQENSLALIEDLQQRALAELKIEEDKAIAAAELMENAEEVKAAIEEKYARKRTEIAKQFAKESEKADKDAIKWSEMSAEKRLGIASQTAGNFATILGKETAAGKAMAITQATIDTYKGATAAYASMASIPYVGPALGGIAAAAAIASGLANVKAIASSGGGGGSAPNISGGSYSSPDAESQTPAPQMMSGAFELSGGMQPEPLKAFVVTDEMTQSQDQLANIRRRATI
tara:strand:- start:3229 stop:5142 length:1914 start_codon:yes stop_codon:yes gene_type:complete